MLLVALLLQHLLLRLYIHLNLLKVLLVGLDACSEVFSDALLLFYFVIVSFDLVLDKSFGVLLSFADLSGPFFQVRVGNVKVAFVTDSVLLEIVFVEALVI